MFFSFRAAILFFGIALLVPISPSYAVDSISALSSIVEKWQSSPHADYTSESFRHWDEDGEIPTSCAACHSSIGLQDFIGADGSAAGQVDHPAAPLTVVGCATCHTSAAEELDNITFPSGQIVSGLDKSAICTVCHQGRQSSLSVQSSVEGMDDDTVSDELNFINVHYRGAAATLFGTQVKGAYEYQGKEYPGKFAHVPGLDSCVGCHDPHNLKVELSNCLPCHVVEELSAIRMGQIDFDADGDVSEGIASEIEALHQTLGRALATYADNVIGTSITYAKGAYPYFFVDTNGNGIGDSDETIYPNRFVTWTPRLLKAAYNYQFIVADPGAYAHNPHYAVQVLRTSIDDLEMK